MKIKLDDNVLVLSGKDKGKTGKIRRILSAEKQIIVEKVNFKTKHIKKTANRAGEKVTFESPINVSNVMLICPNCNKTTRVGYQLPQEGKKIRICKKCKATVEKTFQKKKKEK